MKVARALDLVRGWMTRAMQPLDISTATQVANCKSHCTIQEFDYGVLSVSKLLWECAYVTNTLP